MSELLVIDGPDGDWPARGAPLRTDAAAVIAAHLQADDPTRSVLFIGGAGAMSRARSLGVRVDASVCPLLDRAARARGAISRHVEASTPQSVRSIGSRSLVQSVASAVEGRARCEHHAWRDVVSARSTHERQPGKHARVVFIDPWPGSATSWVGRRIGMFGALHSRMGGDSTFVLERTTPSLAWASVLLDGLSRPGQIRVHPGPTLAALSPGDVAFMPTPWGPEGWLGAAATIAEACRARGAIVVAPARELCTSDDACCLDDSPRSGAEAIGRVLHSAV